MKDNGTLEEFFNYTVKNILYIVLYILRLSFSSSWLKEAEPVFVNV